MTNCSRCYFLSIRSHASKTNRDGSEEFHSFRDQQVSEELHRTIGSREAQIQFEERSVSLASLLNRHPLIPCSGHVLLENLQIKPDALVRSS